MSLLSRIISVVIATFMLAIVYGLFCATMDVLGDHYDPVQSGRRAAANIYSLFGTVTTEAKRNDATARADSNPVSVGQKIAAPYAVTADVAAILGGKLEIAISSALKGVEAKTSQPEQSVPARTSAR